MERLQTAALATTLPSTQPLPNTLLADTTFLRHFHHHTLPYIYSVLGLQTFFWILEPIEWDTIGCPKTSVSNYQSSPHNNPDERSSLFYHVVYKMDHWDFQLIFFKVWKRSFIHDLPQEEDQTYRSVKCPIFITDSAWSVMYAQLISNHKTSMLKV